jgi:siroheme synthase-like protein
VVVVGGGSVGTRKAFALHDAGARVRVIASDLSAELTDRAAKSDRITLEQRSYRGADDIGGAEIVIAATDSAEVNAIVAKDARDLHRLVNVVTEAEQGNFVSMAVHRSGPLAIGVTATNVPSAAARIRDAIAVRFDDRYAVALAAIGTAREKSLGENRDAWARTNAAMIGADFCERVEKGEFAEAAR